jgi:GNAT superfamily N-acetyltransferase
VTDRESVLDLIERVWGKRPAAEEFAWWFDGSPAGPALFATESNGDRVVGLAAMSPLRARVGGQEQPAVAAVQLATDPEYWGRGIFSRLERANEETAAEQGCAVGIVFPNDASRPILLGLGWRQLWRGHVWARPPLPAVAAGSLRIEPLSSIPEESGGLDSTAANGQIIDAAYLDWRYLRSPREYRVLGAYEGDRLRGLVALRPRRDGVAVVAHALGEVAQILRAAGSKWPAIALVPPQQRGAFLRAGFVPTPKSVRVLGKQLRPEGSLAGRWQFQLGDFDVF